VERNEAQTAEQNQSKAGVVCGMRTKRGALGNALGLGGVLHRNTIGMGLVGAVATTFLFRGSPRKVKDEVGDSLVT